MIKSIISSFNLIPKDTHKNLFYLQIFFLITAFFEIITIYSIGPAVAIFLNNDILSNEKLIKILIFFDLDELIDNSLILKIFLPLFFLIFFIISQILIFLSIRLSLKVSYNIAKLLSNNLYFNGLKKNISELSELNTNRLIILLTDETDRFIYSGVMFILRIFSRIIVMIVFLISFIFINFYLSIFLTIFIVTYYFLFYKRIEQKLFDNGKNITEESFKKVKIINETFTNFREISIFNLKNDFLKDMIKINNNLNNSKFINSSITLLPKYVLETILITSVISLGIVSTLYFQNNNISEYFMMIIILIFAGYKLIPTFQEIFVGTSIIKSLNHTIDQLKKHNIEEINDNKPLTQNSNTDLIFKNLKLKNIKFFYNEGEILIKNFDLEVLKGEKICLVGESGSGKSTILDLILGFREPVEGKIYLNNEIISNSLNNNTLKSIVSYVPQKVLLLDKTILENIVLNDQDYDEDKLKDALKLSSLDNFVNQLKNGLDTSVGELGKNVSGGQAQRIAIARSIYREAPIIILDEPTSSLDKKTSTEILENLSNIENKTIIMSSHKIDEIKELKFKMINL